MQIKQEKTINRLVTSGDIRLLNFVCSILCINSVCSMNFSRKISNNLEMQNAKRIGNMWNAVVTREI